MNASPIHTGLGVFSREKFKALVSVRDSALSAFREYFKTREFHEVTTSSLVNIAGSCENPHASFTVPYYGREAHLSQSAQLQLELLVGRLGLKVFTVNNSFREENYDDPEAQGRRLSEFTLIEPESSYPAHLTPQEALIALRSFIEDAIKHALTVVLNDCSADIALLGGDVPYLEGLTQKTFQVITYDDVLDLLNQENGTSLQFGHDLGVREERHVLKYFGNCPTFVTMFPSELKFFNILREPDQQRCFSLDLLTPRLGETVGGALREVRGDVVTQQLVNSRVGQFLLEAGIDPKVPFHEYLALFKDHGMAPRHGFGIGFERFVGFLLNSNDILNTIAYRSLLPQGV